jgi:hypothetical protein
MSTAAAIATSRCAEARGHAAQHHIDADIVACISPAPLWRAHGQNRVGCMLYKFGVRTKNAPHAALKRTILSQRPNRLHQPEDPVAPIVNALGGGNPISRQLDKPSFHTA